MKLRHHMLSLIERVLTAANARCSHMGCTRRRHAGPCRVEHQEHAVPVPAVEAPRAPITLARIRLVKRPSRSIAA